MNPAEIAVQFYHSGAAKDVCEKDDSDNKVSASRTSHLSPGLVEFPMIFLSSCPTDLGEMMVIYDYAWKTKKQMEMKNQKKTRKAAKEQIWK